MWLWVKYVPHPITGLSSKNNKFVFVLEPQKFFIFFTFEALIGNSVNNHNNSIHLSFKKLNFKKLQFYGLGGKNTNSDQGELVLYLKQMKVTYN